ncbi:hypothetical protein Tco_0046798 [Tanacetum coccineum]
MDVLVLAEKETLKFLAQDMSFGCQAVGHLNGIFKLQMVNGICSQAAGHLNGIFKHPLAQSNCIAFAIEV